ncbi:MAG: HlyD family efflux transporter periplasmic adaptor subunit [Planctomycetota bacterium]|nr:MAG: HlyD family efflux transporter periplasmic adaptor subunit [Planctomycetota bacterium]REJ96019.1 MAG: HlyD family efflux transporter periplasmic adaptor subunit [Planctomycetota bacterium]REK25487.1 MAG: HlyD family efflux transporter periplasmic adaptor subunit [Planctomycetota bacterium]REK45923.1 MAG: HlyD family efflux transporter periplasmic adaptor subunit [Planctomycetota bacterium]
MRNRVPANAACSALILFLFVIASLGTPPLAVAKEPVIHNCLVSAIDDVDVPAKEAGVLTELPARPGQQVSEGEVLGKIDDERALLARQLALIEVYKAREASENDINVRFAVSAAEVAEAKVASANAANAKVPDTIPASEVRELELEAKRAKLQIEQATFEQDLLKYDIRSRNAEFKAAEQDVARRQVASPLEGEIFEVHRDRGEWVQAGDPVLRVVRMNRLQVHGYVRQAKVARRDVIDRPVTITVKLDGDRERTFDGKIVFASSETTGGGEFRIAAEVENVQEDGLWVIKPGQQATITIR